MRKTFNSFDMIGSLLWQALKAFAKVAAISAILVAIVWFFVEAIVNA